MRIIDYDAVEMSRLNRARQWTKLIHIVLTPDLLKPKWKAIADKKGTRYCGHCYHAAEALYWLLGGPDSGCKPMTVHHEGGTHWFLKTKEGNVLDPTAEQFIVPPPYDEGRGRGFLTKKPSKRAAKVIQRAKFFGVNNVV